MHNITRQTFFVALGFALFVVPLLGGWGSAVLHAGVPVLSLDWLIPGWIAWLVLAPAAFVWLGKRRARLLAVVEEVARLLPDDTPPHDCADCGRVLPSDALYCIHCGHRAKAMTGKTVRL